MVAALVVDYKGGIGFDVTARNHHVAVDLPLDSGMSPPELFVASLGSCIGVYVVRYCQNAKLDCSGLKIELDWKLSDDKTKISEMDIRMTLPVDPGKREGAILQAAHHCLIHNTILGQPTIRIALNKT
jgi:putative redox protein